jgi:aerobic-type carbon monoxide dehydrogenase small subunit (CoxS/CutS family)
MERITFALNGMPVEVVTDPLRRLADVLRNDLGQTGLKTGCPAGDCGGCTVRIDGRQQAACRVAVARVEGCAVATLDA